MSKVSATGRHWIYAGIVAAGAHVFACGGGDSASDAQSAQAAQCQGLMPPGTPWDARYQYDQPACGASCQGIMGAYVDAKTGCRRGGLLYCGRGGEDSGVTMSGIFKNPADGTMIEAAWGLGTHLGWTPCTPDEVASIPQPERCE